MTKDGFKEFGRYIVAGGTAAVCDIAANWAMLNLVLHSDKDDAKAVAISVIVGFFVGTIINYAISSTFVFRNASKGNSFKGFIGTAIIGIIGLALAEGFTFLGIRFIGSSGTAYILLNCIVKLLVFLWNYAGRKIFIFR